MTQRSRVLAILVVAAAAAAVAGTGLAPAGPTASATLDRTFSCAVVPRGGARELESRAHAGTRDAGRWFKLPFAALRAGVFSGATGNLLVWVTAGKPVASTTIDQEFETFDVRTFGTIGVRAALCSATTRPIPLSRAGLRGGPAAALGNELECLTPKRVLVRVRARLTTAATLRGQQDFRALHVPVHEAQFAVRTLTGKPLAYATVAETGRATLFTAKGCRPE